MKKTRVLVIDDEKVVVDSVRRILSEEGYETEGALAAPQGLQRALAEEWDLVMTDIRMPDIGGMRILRDIKREKPALPVMIITGYATVQSAVGAMKLGAADYVEKPFTPQMLAGAVREALRKAAAGRPEPQELIHREEISRILERAAVDSEFVASLFYDGADALEEYPLTAAEKLAILTGDIQWIEKHLGSLTAQQRRWLEQRLSAEIW